jgi:hypothetical protein
VESLASHGVANDLRFPDHALDQSARVRRFVALVIVLHHEQLGTQLD